MTRRGPHDHESMNIEPYRKAAAALHHAQRERGVRTVMVASAIPAEGKSRTTVRLAVTLAQSYGRRVLLLDADLRRPVLHEIFGVAPDGGLNELLLGDAPIVDVPTIPVGDRLALLPAGHANREPLGLLTSTRMREVLTHASRRFDWVLVDTPPVVLLPDSELLASMVDAALLVVAAGETDYRLVAQAVQAVGRERIVGVVLNKVDEAALPAYAAYEYAAQ